MIPEKDLWRTVLLQAVLDLTGADAARAKSWFLSDRSSLGSFLWICNSLNLDPEAVRRQAFRPSMTELKSQMQIHSTQHPRKSDSAEDPTHKASSAF